MSRRKQKENTKQIFISLFIILLIVLAYFMPKNEVMQNNIASSNNVLNNETINVVEQNIVQNEITSNKTSYTNLNEIPEYTNEVRIEINNNKPYFTEKDYTTQSFEKYSELDSLGRCGVAYANICKEIMPKKGEKRGDISKVHPTGWRQIKVNGEYLYNRCHLIAYSLADENANNKNLITGTRYFNVDGMLPVETMVSEYINKNENNHVLYRVTPVFKNQNLVATGVEMEGYSVEDNGKGIEFNYFVYNIQPGVKINYQNGKIIK